MKVISLDVLNMFPYYGGGGAKGDEEHGQMDGGGKFDWPFEPVTHSMSISSPNGFNVFADEVRVST